jgi:hypothetical protein
MRRAYWLATVIFVIGVMLLPVTDHDPSPRSMVDWDRLWERVKESVESLDSDVVWWLRK